MAVRLDFARKHQRVRVCRRSCGSAPYLNPVDHFWLQSGQQFRFNAIVANRGRNLVRIFQRDLQRPVRPAHGYNHNENDSEKGYANLTTTEKKMVLRGLRTFGTIDIASDSLSRGEPVFAEVPVQIRVLAMT